MPYYLKHPDHGTHIAYTPEEVEWCRSEQLRVSRKENITTG